MRQFNPSKQQRFWKIQLRFKPFQLICTVLCLSVVLGFVLIAHLPAFASEKVTITVDFAAKQPGLSSMSGFLYGVGENKPQDHMMPLQPNLWRSSSLNLYPRITQLGSQFQLLVSDTWGYGLRGWSSVFLWTLAFSIISRLLFLLIAKLKILVDGSWLLS